jgi:anthranilate/para-aminobenzoate synthase component I
VILENALPITLPAGFFKNGNAGVQAGGGWVNVFELETEFQETVNKSKAMLNRSTLFARASRTD